MKRRFRLQGPDVGRLILDRLVAEGVRYGRDFALVRISIPLGSADYVAPLLSGALRDADVIVRWEADELLVLLPGTDRAGVDRAAQRLRAAVDFELGLGAAHWMGDTPFDLLARAEPKR